MLEVDIFNLGTLDLFPGFQLFIIIAFIFVGYSVFWKSPRNTMSKRKSEKLANGSAEIDHENSEENSEEVEDTKDSRASKRVAKQTTEKADKKKKDSSRSSRKRSPSKSLKEDEESDTEYEVLKIIDVKTDKKGKKQFLVNWKGYSNKDNTWEPEENLSCNDLIEEFYKEAKTKSPKKAEKAASKSPRGGKKKKTN